MAPVEKTALQCVMEVDHERIKLENEAERLAALSEDDGKENSVVHISRFIRNDLASLPMKKNIS